MPELLLVTPSFYPATVYGGPIFSTLYTAKELAKTNWNIKVSTTNANRPGRLNVQPNTWTQLEKNIKVKYYHDTFLDRLSLPMLLGLKKDMRTVDIVHTQYIFSLSTLIALKTAKKLRKPIVISPRGSFAPWILQNGLQFKKQWIKILIKLSDGAYWHATSEQEKQEIEKNIPNPKVIIAPNGFDDQSLKAPNLLTKQEFIKKFVGIEAKPDYIIISMGRYQRKKAFDELIRAHKILLTQKPNAYLVIAGQDEGEKENLKHLINELGVSHRVFLINPVFDQDKTDFFYNADIFALLSNNENFGNVYAEALAMGTPIVASKETPWQEVNTQKCGIWTKKDAIAGAKAITELLNSDLEIYSKNAVEFIKAYTWEKSVAKLASHYKNIINQT